ncbi:MAG: hypothetical protein R3A48_26020 [Polyangiales bacterium]
MFDRLLPTPRLVELDGVDLALDSERLWDLARHGDLLGRTPVVRALFALRTLPERLRGDAPEGPSLHLDELRSSAERPGFQVLLEEPGREVAVGAIGQVWHVEIPFVHVAGADEFAAYSAGSQVKVAWSLRVIPLGERRARLEVEVRVDATDEDAWTAFKRYFLANRPRSRFIRRSTEPLGDSRCRLISRFRTSCSDDLLTRLAQGPSFVEPVGFAMDRRMLLGIKARVERDRAARGA